MTGLPFARRLVVLFLLLGAGVAGVRGAPGEVLRVAQNIPGDSKPIVLHADEVATWAEGNQRVILLKGTVWVEQGVVNARMQGATAVIDLDQKRRTGVMQVKVYGEGDVRLESGPDNRKGTKTVLELNTRGELKLKAQKGKIIQQPMANDPFYRRSLAELGVRVTPDIQRASAVQAPAPTAKPQAAKQAPLGPPAAVPFTTTGTPSPPAPAGALAPPPSVQPASAPVAAPAAGSGSASPPPPPSVKLGPPPPPNQGAAAPANPPALQQTAAFIPAGQSSDIVLAQAQFPAPSDPPPAGAPPVAAPTPGPYVPGPPPAGSPPSAFPGPPPPGGTLPPPVGGAPPATPPGSAPGPPTPPTPPAPPPARQLRIVPRTSQPIQYQLRPLPNGEQAYIITGGIILTIRGVSNGPNLLDIEADRVVVWSHGNLQQFMGGLRTAEGQQSREGEFYLSGHVEIRTQTGQEKRTLRADEVYYDVARNVAVARDADLEFTQKGLPDPIHFRADELLQLSATQFKGYRAEIFSSRLPSDPGLKVYFKEATVENKVIPKRSIFGRQYFNRQTGEPESETQRLVKANNVFLEVEDVPVFYLPFLQGDANDPLGPLQSINFKYDRIFGFQFYSTFNVYDLIGVEPVPGTHWKAYFDYLHRRGPALGSDYDYAGKDLFDLPGKYEGLVRAYGIYDNGTDILGGGRGENEDHPLLRGRFLWRHQQELPNDFTLQTQISALSDKNFLEQYYKLEFDREYNQETFIYLKQQRDNWAWTALVEPRIRTWVTETERLPELAGHLIGQSFFDRLTYNADASAGYYQLKPTNFPPFPVEPTTRRDETGRFDLRQELSMPFSLGPVRLVPYAVLDLTYYTNDLTGTDRGRVYEAGGLRASLPLTRLYPDVQSELLNLNGINHKIVLSGNVYVAHSDTAFTRLPQLDRLNDDNTDQAIRDIKPQLTAFNPDHGFSLMTSPLYDPQLYAIHQLIDNRIDTLDSVQAVEADIRQRWQTKRGYPGMQHVVDWMTLDVSGAYFTNAGRDTFGEHFSYVQYNWLWNIGDRTALESTGWAEPENPAARVFTVGAYLNRPDRTYFYLGYRDIFPLQSRAVTGAVTYVFSPKYAMTASTTYDFGTNVSQSNSLVLTRMGSDLQVSLGVSYNSILSNFGVTFEIFPNLVPENRRQIGSSAGLFSRQ